jgi:hypothetical protein
MELEKLTKMLQNTSLKIEKAYFDDIIKITNMIFDEYDITYKNTHIPVEKNIFLNKFKIFQTNNVLICKGISKNGNKCSRKASVDSKYCKTHNYLSFREHLNEKIDITENIFVIEKNHVDIDDNIDDNIDIKNIQKMELKLINDSFYYIDNEYIYEKESLNKVGYIHNKEYILTDDPFILYNI